MKWSLFAGAALVAWMFLFAFGAPLASVMAGTGAMALWNYWRKRRTT